MPLEEMSFIKVKEEKNKGNRKKKENY